MKTDPRVDAYIAKAAPSAQPLLAEVRKRIHKACPDATETIKWNVPFYEATPSSLPPQPCASTRHAFTPAASPAAVA